ncbi:putative secreted protein (Por secretion system target) [Arcicella aurantiaca]|uniref:Putative secreted protein (Por secretion system target) n=1 Tax=Arcicella aurantiaca TaxID=591202 RepID=A0A316E984_9BACT|nr:T9SS type A sorting domain-containing protein [Arcicella aurantiaca]PWK27318.1 putative secreted protein (Por secretion system target) [Arcicella aurantiaca]
MFKKLLLIFLFLSTTNFLYSQITISSPVIRQIFQRDLNNQATVTITGSYSQPVDTIQVRFTPVKAGQGTAIDWTVIKSAPLGGLFKGSIVVKGGWYTMDVRGLLKGKQVGNISTIERVGVGEVFVIAGQSNAGGSSLLEANETAATDDRVNCANFISPRTYYSDYPFRHADLSQFSIIEFAQLTKTSAIGPTGLGPYYWGKVGDALSAKLNVPIMFFNAGWAGASVRVWRESAENPTKGVPSDFQSDNPNDPIRYYEVGTPYSNLSATLRYYGINLGVRAVLWMEGETQNLLNLSAARNNKPQPVTEASYLDNLQRLIKKTRQDLGTNKLAWVVARTSYSGDLDCKSNTIPLPPPPAPSPIIVSAQNKAIADPTLFPMYPGPFSDTIQVAKLRERDQCVHFTGKGLDNIASAWIKALTEDNKNFFQTVEPILADTIPSVSLDCISSGALKLSLPSGYAGYEWVNTGNNTIVGTTQSVTVGSGTYIARATRSNGNIIQVPQFTVKANTPPLAPTVKALSDVNFCLGTSVALQSTTEADNPIYEWVSSPAITNLPRTKDISATREGAYKLRVIDKNACASSYSTEVKLVAKPRPEKPFIATSGSTALCQGQTLTLTSTNVGASSYLWSNGEKTQAISVKNAGTYNVQTVGSNGCLSPSSTDNIAVIVNSLPSTPQIRALSDTVFCDGASVSLVLTPSDNSTKFGWNRNNSVNNADNSTTIKISGTELVKGFVVDTKGCQSLLSNAIQVVKKDNPQTLSIVPKSTYSFVARASNKVDEYVWKLDGKILSAKDSLIRTVDKGTYTVLGKNIYKVKSSSLPLICSSAESEKYDFNPYDDKGLSVYPNPSSGTFTLESRYDLDKVIISVWTMDGRAVYKSDVINTFNSPRKIDVSALSEGMYILKIESTTFKLTKFISIVR